jgi:putative membrane protein insertion efficiency factor
VPFIAAVWAYRITLGPLLGGQCRFHPTCSQYALDAYRMHGPVRASVLTVRRLLRCHPFVKGGFDPVPLPERPGSQTGRKRPGV